MYCVSGKCFKQCFYRLSRRIEKTLCIPQGLLDNFPSRAEEEEKQENLRTLDDHPGGTEEHDHYQKNYLVKWGSFSFEKRRKVKTQLCFLECCCCCCCVSALYRFRMACRVQCSRRNVPFFPFVCVCVGHRFNLKKSFLKKIFRTMETSTTDPCCKKSRSTTSSSWASFPSFQ